MAARRGQRLALCLCGPQCGHRGAIHRDAVARRQQHAGLFEQLANRRHPVADLVVATQVRAAADGLETVDDGGVGHRVGVVDAPAGEHVGAAHERHRVVAAHHQHLERLGP